MDIGAKIKELRQAAGLSQRQLCGDRITRNMLSQIENGSARPSMDTLAFLASQLGKSVSYFLEENGVTSPNLQVIQQARQALVNGAYGEGLRLLQQYESPDDVFDGECCLLRSLLTLHQAEQALAENRTPYAKQLLEQVDCSAPYGGLLEGKKQLLLTKVGAETLLPDADDLLMEKAKRALVAGKSDRAAAYLQAVDNQNSATWKLTRGRAYMAVEEYTLAAKLLAQVEEVYPQQVIPLLEQCYIGMQDYKRAYEYACKQKK